MLIGNSTPEYVFIRIVILALRIIAPLSILYTLVIIRHSIIPTTEHDFVNQHRLPLPLEIYLYIEAAFFLVVYLPLKIHFQTAAIHPEPPSEPERRVLWQRVLDSVADTERYLPGWFFGADIGTIARHDAREFVGWSLLSKHARELDVEERDELDGYLDDLEHKVGQKFVEGEGRTKSLRTTFDHVPMQHRPLLWYLIVFLVDGISHARFRLSSFRFYRSSFLSTLSIFPPRPLALLGYSQPSNQRLSYWYKEHKSKTKPPVVFLHGIGVGLYPYVDFVLQLVSRQHDDDADVGIIVIELLPISSRICAPALSTAEMHTEIRNILDNHGWKDFVLIGHSYGTAIASTILRDKVFSQRVKAAMLLDPICLLLHLPDVAFNFTRRVPRRANERMLHYFSSQDMLISHTLARRFFWAEYILWKEDLDPDLPLTVVLSAKDLIVPTREVWSYLTGTLIEDAERHNKAPLDGALEWKKDKLEVLWFKDFDHAGLFASKGARRGIASHARTICVVDNE